VEEYLKAQGRFAHLFKEENKDILRAVQEYVDAEWERLQKQCAQE
jgi:pyruvate ferredoxin oxidoreductase beta subunit